MALPDLTGQNIENTYQRVIQTDGTNFYDGTGSLVNFGGAVFPYTGSAIISGSLIVTGSTDIQYLTASGLNYPTIDGYEKQLITTDGSGNLSFDWADRTNLDVKNKISKERKFDGVILAVAHNEFKNFQLGKFLKPNNVVYDVKGFLNKEIIGLREKKSFTDKPFLEFASTGSYYFKDFSDLKYYTNKTFHNKKLIKRNDLNKNL